MIKDQTKQWQNKTEKEPCANKKEWLNYRKHTKTNQYFNWLIWTYNGIWGLSLFRMGQNLPLLRRRNCAYEHFDILIQIHDLKKKWI